MLVTDYDALLEYVKTAPTCDGKNHDWVQDDEDEAQGGYHCAGCFIIKERGQTQRGT